MSAQEAVPGAGSEARPQNGPHTGLDVEETANDRYKKSYQSWFWGSIIVATVLHFGVFALWPDMTTEDVSFTADELENIELPPEVEIPPPPEAISRPATPVVTDAQIDEDITISPTTFEDNPVENLPPPPEETGGDISAAPTLTPYTVRPELRNRAEVARALQREYPPILRDSGIDGTVGVWFFIDENGVVQDTRIETSSGQQAFDDAALDVADIMEFSPALNRDERVPVWISMDIAFTSD